MPIYNVETYLDEAIGSILNQSLNDFELILVNDGSTDNSGRIAQKYVEEDQRVRLINKANGGLSSARNAGLEVAKGEFIYFIDSDDSINPEMLQRIHEIFLNYEVDIVGFTARSFFEGSEDEKKCKSANTSENFYARVFLKQKMYDTQEYYTLCSSQNNFVASACLYVTRRMIIDRATLRFKNGIIHEDELFTRELLIASDKIFFTRDDLYNRRIRMNSISTTTVPLNKATSFIIISNSLFALNNKKEYSQLQIDSLHFFNWAVRLLDEYPYTSSEYKQVLKLLFSSSMYSRSLEMGNRKTYIQNKRIKKIKKIAASLRYQLGLGTKLRRLFRSYKV